MRLEKMKGAALVLAALAAGAATASGEDTGPPPGYYSTAEDLTGTALETALHNIVDGHTLIPYSATDEAMAGIDEAAAAPGNVTLLYTDRTRPKSQFGGGNNGTGASGDWNREHIWPRSYGIFNDDGSDNSDLFNLRPADVDTNQVRGNLFFDRSSGSPQIYPGGEGSTFDGDSWEPPDDEKGDIARSCFYMAVRYDGTDPLTTDLVLSDSPDPSAGRFGILTRLVAWSALDPVDAAERRRNHQIFTRYQRNRNPFIDRPEFAGQLFLAGRPEEDSDRDGLSDFWEYRFLDGLAGAPADDGDGDGINILLECALLLDPKTPDAAGLPKLSRMPDGALQFDYRRNRLAPAISYEIQRSVALEPDGWAAAPGGTVQVVDAGDDLRAVSVTFPPGAGAQRGFYRLRVSTTPHTDPP